MFHAQSRILRENPTRQGRFGQRFYQCMCSCVGAGSDCSRVRRKCDWKTQGAMLAELATTDMRSSELGGIPRRCTSKAIHVKHETRKHGTRVRQESERAWQICTHGCMRTIHITQYILTLFLMDSLAREWRIIKEISFKVIECV